MIYLGYFILGAVLLAVILLAAPISLGYDSVEKWFQVRWLGLTLTKRLAARKPPKSRKIAKKKRKIHGLAVISRFWQKRDLVWQTLNQLRRFVLGVVSTLSFRDSVATFSLPDPMWNGVLYGLLSNFHLREFNLSVNFEQRNYAKIWVTVYPHRLVRQLAVQLLHLPYLHIMRFARALKHQAERG